MPSNNPGQTLLPIARASIAHALGRRESASETSPWLQELGACFVTLTQRGALRGCIGSLAARRPLVADVKANSVAAAFNDPRFSPLAAEELDLTEIETSLLSPMQAIEFANEAQALDQLRPGIDGVVFEFGARRSTFLPQVWEQLPDAGDFIAQLKHKAGLPVRFWADGVRLHRYTVSKWKENRTQPS
jgi:uncharacterized protein